MASEPKVAVSLMTRNRPHYLRLAMQSILSQTGVDLDLLVLDNASNDDTPQVVASFNDPRITYCRSETDIGIMRNWNRGIQMASSRAPFVSIFHDDDLMLPGFLSQSVQALLENPSAGMCLSLTEFIDGEGKFLQAIGPGEMKPGLNRSLDFAELKVQSRAPLIYPPAVIFSAETLRRIGPADSPHSRTTSDLNHWYRAVLDSDVCFIPSVLTQYRQHTGTDTHVIHQQMKALGCYSCTAENADLLAHLLRSERAADPGYRQWLSDRFIRAHALQSSYIHDLSSQMYHTPENRIAMFVEWLEHALPEGCSFVLADEMELSLSGTLDGRRIVPIVNNNGQYWGPPEGGEHAIAEVERARQDGVQWLVIAWPCLWWLDIYSDLDLHLRQNYRMMNFPHGVIFDLSRN